MKDLDLAMTTAKELNMLPMVAPLSHEVYAMLKVRGGARGFFPEVITVFEDYAGIEARSQETR